MLHFIRSWLYSSFMLQFSLLKGKVSPAQSDAECSLSVRCCIKRWLSRRHIVAMLKIMQQTLGHDVIVGMSKGWVPSNNRNKCLWRSLWCWVKVQPLKTSTCLKLSTGCKVHFKGVLCSMLVRLIKMETVERFRSLHINQHGPALNIVKPLVFGERMLPSNSKWANIFL